MSSLYVLRRADPTGAASDPITVEADSADEALLLFEKELGSSLEFCEEEDVGEFVLDPSGQFVRKSKLSYMPE